MPAHARRPAAGQECERPQADDPEKTRAQSLSCLLRSPRALRAQSQTQHFSFSSHNRSMAMTGVSLMLLMSPPALSRAARGLARVVRAVYRPPASRA
jgi:hypothetical protein